MHQERSSAASPSGCGAAPRGSQLESLQAVLRLSHLEHRRVGGGAALKRHKLRRDRWRRRPDRLSQRGRRKGCALLAPAAPSPYPARTRERSSAMANRVGLTCAAWAGARQPGESRPCMRSSSSCRVHAPGAAVAAGQACVPALPVPRTHVDVGVRRLELFDVPLVVTDSVPPLVPHLRA